MTLSELFDRATPPELASLILDSRDSPATAFKMTVANRLASSPPNASAASIRYELLRFLVNDTRSNVVLQALAEENRQFDRDEAVVGLWKFIEENDGIDLVREHFSLLHHRRRLFAWLVERYDLSRARRIFTTSRFLRFVLLIPLAASVSAAILFPNDRWAATLSVLLAYVLPTVLARFCGMPVFEFIQSLVPRLAGTAAAGAALLLSTEKLLLFLSERVRSSALLLILIASSYLALEILERTRPRPTFVRLLPRLLNVVQLALSHAVAIVLLIVPAIRWVMKEKGDLTPRMFSPQEILVFATAVFTAGLILNVIWAEEPVTKPL